jgi:acetyltransferase-like isoleucine patch superfamily enzyme
MPTAEGLIKINKEAGGNIAPNAFVSPLSKVFSPINAMHNTTIYGNTTIGKYSFFNVNTVIYSNTTIGKYCSIARNVEIGVANHPTNWLSGHPLFFDTTIFKNKEYIEFPKVKWEGHKETTIGNDCWVGAKVVIAAGVTIGNGCIIAAGAIVTKDIPDYSIYGGIPAKKIKMRFDKEMRDLLQSFEWWDQPLSIIKKLDFSNEELLRGQIKGLL